VTAPVVRQTTTGTVNTADFAERRQKLLHGIEQNEGEMREAVLEFAEVAENKLDLTGFIRSHPLAWMTGAFCLGLWLGQRPVPCPPTAWAIDQRRCPR